MAKRRTAEATAEPALVGDAVNEVLSTLPAAGGDTDFDPVALESQPAAEPANVPAPMPRTGHAEAVRKRRVEHSKLTIPAGDLTVHLLDKGDNSAGIGIRVTMPEDRKLSDQEKEIIREVVKGEENGYPSDFNWNGQMGLWHKAIGPETTPARAVAIRLDAENRVERLAEELRDHQADPAGFAERVQQRREQAANADRIPD